MCQQISSPVRMGMQISTKWNYKSCLESKGRRRTQIKTVVKSVSNDVTTSIQRRPTKIRMGISSLMLPVRKQQAGRHFKNVHILETIIEEEE